MACARFRSGFLEEACEDLFYQMVHRLGQADELSKEAVFIDGTKLEACANKYTFVWKKSVWKLEEKMFIKIQEAVKFVNQEFIQSFCVGTEYRAQDLQKVCRFLEEICRERNMEFVHGRGKRKPSSSGIWNCSKSTWSARPLMTGIQPASREGITTAKQIRMLHLCT